MTLTPSASRNVRGVSGPPIPPSLTCGHPGCLDRAHERHHLWRRSLLAGAYDWVQLEEGPPVQNILFLCREHHRQITDNEAWVRLVGGLRSEFTLPENMSPDLRWWQRSGSNWVDLGSVTYDFDSSYCASCGQRKRAPKLESKLPARKSKTLTIKVPDDEENGADVFDTLVDALCDDLGYEGSKGMARYHAAVAAMTFTLLNKEQFLSEIEEGK